MNPVRPLLFLVGFAVFAACASRGDRIDDHIRRLTQGESRSDRADAAKALGRIRGGTPLSYVDDEGYGIGPLPLEADVERAVRALSRVLREETDGYVRAEAAWALAQLRPPGPNRALVECAAFDPYADSMCEWALLVVADPTNLEGIASLIGEHRNGATIDYGDSGEEVGRYVYFSFQELGERGISYLEQILREDRDRLSVRIALHQLGEIGTASAHEVIARALDDPHAAHRFSALVVLYPKDGQRWADRKYLPMVMRLLLDPSKQNRDKAASVLGIPEPLPPSEPLIWPVPDYSTPAGRPADREPS